MRLSDHLDEAGDGFDQQAEYARKHHDAEGAALSDRLADHMRRLAGNHRAERIYEGGESADPQQLGENAALVSRHALGQRIGEDIAAIRAELGLTQEAFADAINAATPGAGVNRFSISRWESGRVIPSSAMAATIRRIASRISA